MDDWFTKLKFSLLSTHTLGDIRQPENHFVSCVPRGYSRWQTAYEYFSDVERILQEMKAAISFVTTPPEKDFLEKHKIQSENYILYHQGYFLDLIHQLKDKLCQLVKCTIAVKGNYSDKQQKNLTLNKLLNDSFITKISNLKIYLNEWDDTNSNGVIAQALKKRTFYHHYENPLTKIDSYFHVRSNRMLLGDDFKNFLNEAIKGMIMEKIDVSYKILQTDAVKKMTDIFNSVENNIQKISKSLVSYFKFPQKNSKKIRKIMMKFVQLENYFRIPKSNYTMSSMDSIFQKAIIFLKNSLEQKLGEEMAAFYITGSVLRKEYVYGFSDVNFVLVLNNENGEMNKFLREYFDSVVMTQDVAVDLIIVSKKKFYEQGYEKLRFICQTDGLLLAGKDLLQKENDFIASFKIAWLLNNDFKQFIEDTKKMLRNPLSANLNSIETGKILRNIVKRVFRLNFAMVIGNNLRYAPDFKNMHLLSNFYYPENKKFCDFMYIRINNYLITNKKEIFDLIEVFEEKTMPLYNKMEELMAKSN